MTRTSTRRRRASIVAAACLALLAVVPSAHASFRLEAFSGSLHAPDGSPELRAGAHPDFTTLLRVATVQTPAGEPPDGSLHDVTIQLPTGLVGNPSAAATCSDTELSNGPNGVYTTCPVESQVGVVDDFTSLAPSVGRRVGIYNMVPPPGVPAQFAFNDFGVLVKFNAGVRTGGDYGLTTKIDDISQALPIIATKVTLWGVPADPVHDPERMVPGQPNVSGATSDATPAAFMTNPTDCSGGALTVTAIAHRWGDPDHASVASFDHDDSGNPLAMSDCGTLPFAPTVTIQPTVHSPDSPTGLDVEIRIPQNDSPRGRASAHLRRVEVTLPEGMTINPASAAGLAACSPAQISVRSAAAPTCPDAAKVGSVEIDTPLLAQPLTGSVYLATQDDNPFHSMLALYLVAEGPGTLIKLPGRIALDPSTGRLTTTFDDAPQLPFSALKVRFDSGPRAPLATPATCGTKTAGAVLTPWSGGPSVTATDSFTIDCTAGLGAFAPSMTAGTQTPTGGAFAPFLLHIDRADGQATLDGVTLNLPPGLLAKLSGVARCADAQADAGACDAASRIGTATVTAGSGSEPLALRGGVYLTGPYKGAPFGLAVRVRAVAGPLDLGTIVVRQALQIDPFDAHVTVVSDPLPTIVAGVPVRLRSLDVAIDRPGFMFNPTSCDPVQITGALGAVDGRVAPVATRFQVGDCQALKFGPSLRLGLSGAAKQLRDGGHPALSAVLTQPAGQANLQRVQVRLPLSLALDAAHAQALCELADGSKVDPSCPKGSIVGHAKAFTPILDQPLTGPVYFVKNVRRDAKTGRLIRTLPMLVIPLRGEGVALDLRATTAVSSNHLVSTFPAIPDAPVSRFELTLSGGAHGILAVNGSVCRRSRAVGLQMDAHNGARADSTKALSAGACARPRRR